MPDYCNVAPCSLVHVYRIFRGVCCPHPQVTFIMKTAVYSEKSLHYYQSIRHPIPEDFILNHHEISPRRCSSSFCLRAWFIRRKLLVRRKTCKTKSNFALRPTLLIVNDSRRQKFLPIGMQSSPYYEEMTLTVICVYLSKISSHNLGICSS